MDKELKKTIKQLLWLDSMLISKDSLWSILDEIEDELEDIFKDSKKKEISLDDWMSIKK